jgi:xanthine dehydrogenase YagS FAD-binding subunit
MKSFSWVNATSLEEAFASVGERAVIKAGGVDLLDRMKERIDEPERLVNIRNLKNLDRIAVAKDGSVEIGPLVTLAQLAAHPELRKRHLALSAAASHAATPQIRNMATLGGNLLQRPRCWYFRSEEFRCKKKGGDTCFALEGENAYHAIFGNRSCAIVHPSATAGPLVALGAKVELTSAKGKRELLLEQFFVTPEKDVTKENVLAPGELVTAVRIPLTSTRVRSAYSKQGEKESFDWPLADVTVVLELEGKTCKKAAIVLGAAAPVPWRAVEAEKALVGKTLDASAAAIAADRALVGATPLAKNRYKTALFEALVRRTVLAAGGLTA